MIIIKINVIKIIIIIIIVVILFVTIIIITITATTTMIITIIIIIIINNNKTTNNYNNNNNIIIVNNNNNNNNVITANIFIMLVFIVYTGYMHIRLYYPASYSLLCVYDVWNHCSSLVSLCPPQTFPSCIA